MDTESVYNHIERTTHIMVYVPIQYNSYISYNCQDFTCDNMEHIRSQSTLLPPAIKTSTFQCWFNVGQWTTGGSTQKSVGNF